MTDNEKRLMEASALIKAFEEEQEPERLREAALELEDVNLRNVHNAQIRHKQRSDCLELWLTILQTIDKHMDSSFNPEDVPQMSVMPPQTKSGIQYPPGAAPAVVDDPQARQDYEKAIKANQEKQQSYLMQTQLHDLNEQLTSKVDAFLRTAYMMTTVERDELRTTIDRIIENQSRKESLYRSIPTQPEN